MIEDIIEIETPDGAMGVIRKRPTGPLPLPAEGPAGGRTPVPPTVAVDNMMPLRVGGPNLAKDGDMYHGQLDDVYVQLG